jgi:murein DD-endopeptidase MepM/ murein hydrolase activator NlpD
MNHARGGFSVLPVMVHPTQRTAVRERKPAAIIVASNGKIRTFKVRPGLLAAVFGGFVAFSAAYLAAAAYLLFRDDLLGAALQRQVDMQYAYEDRIAALRAELDRVTSRHAVETLGVEEQLSLLLSRQSAIAERQSTLDDLVAHADGAGVAVAAARLPRARPPAPGEAPGSGVATPALAYAPEEAGADIITGTLMQAPESVRARPTLRQIRSSLDAIEAEQAQALDALATAAGGEAERLEKVLAPLAIDAAPADGEPQGGPFIAAGDMHFVERAALLRRTLDAIAGLRSAAAAAPIRSPLAGGSLSSRFGYRIDPFLRRPAFHAGIDFAATAGAPVYAAAAGVVASAGRAGGYGRMVEIRHADGLSTRYGHLSSIAVEEGERVESGEIIGAVGSSGRSTGPHLHYETRRDGEAVDPAPFLAAGRAL